MSNTFIIYGTIIVVALVLNYFKNRSKWYMLAFALSCLVGAIFGYLQRDWFFTALNSFWFLIGLYRFWKDSKSI
jgi:uncharacterized membrane protein